MFWNSTVVMAHDFVNFWNMDFISIKKVSIKFQPLDQKPSNFTKRQNVQEGWKKADCCVPFPQGSNPEPLGPESPGNADPNDLRPHSENQHIKDTSPYVLHPKLI